MIHNCSGAGNALLIKTDNWQANKNLIKDAVEHGVNRIVADPAAERLKKNLSANLNRQKAEHIALGMQAKKDSAAALGTKRPGGPSTDTPTEKRTKLSTGTAPAVQMTPAQPQMGLPQPQLVGQQNQFPQQQGMPPLPIQHQQNPNALFHPFGMQPAQPQVLFENPEQHVHVGVRGYDGQYGYPHGPPQQLGVPQPFENQPQTQNSQELNYFQQQSGNLQQPGDQPAAMPGLIPAAANTITTPGTHDGPQSS